MHLRLPSLCLTALVVLGCARKDVDLDGIVDRRDPCPTVPESANGWQDADGCPDELARLEVRVTLDGEPVPGAAVSLPGAPPLLTDAQGRAAFFELVPVERGVFVHIEGADHVRDVQASLREGENRLVVDLTP